MAARPRLLIITPDFPPARGGIQLMAHRLATEIAAFRIETVTLEEPGGRALDAAGALAVRRVGVSRAPRAVRNVALDAVAVREAVRFRPDVTLSLHIVAAPAAWATRRLTGARAVQYYHAKEIPARPRLARLAADRADVVIAVSDYCERLIRETGARPREVRRIPPGVDVPEQTSAEPTDRPTIVTISRLEDRYKGHDVMIRALPAVRAAVPDVRWVVIGEGSLRGELEAAVRAQGLADLTSFLGAVDDAERDLWLRRARLLAMPSRLPEGGRAGEGFGIAFMEAAAYGKPVVAGAVGGALDSVVDGETGLLVDPRDPAAVAAAIIRLLSDPALAGRLGAAGAARAREFSWPAIAARVESVLLEQTGGRA